jgi:hypothetical protein
MSALEPTTTTLCRSTISWQTLHNETKFQLVSILQYERLII